MFPAIVSLLAACSGIPVHGIIAGQTIDSRVDSEVARYYVTNYLQGKHSDPALDARIDQVYKKIDGTIPGRAELKAVSDEFSADFAALLFADEISRVPLNRRFRSIFDVAYDYARKAVPEGRAKLPAAADRYEALIVPTYLYNRPTLSGADLAAPRAALQKVGLICQFVETSDDGPVESNAEIVMAAIRARAQSGRRLIIISASKSGAEVALALTKLRAAETRHVAAWINTVGALQGTPLIDDNMIPELEFIVGKIDPAGVESMSVTRSRERFKSFQVPPQILVVNFFGIPVSGSVGFRARRGFFPMRKYGPNDGMVLLGDMIFPGGITLTELGSDHFLMNDHLDVTAVALAITVIQWLENPAGENSPTP
ncbi:MAG TPA: hypothetical protein VFY96_02935 [Candidatus Binatia bacterium]|nr:hypothetical protein [Candidatus Binatia bacterium]